jgi:hypothetical protein
MPIDKIITFAFGVLGTLLVLHGPLHLQEEMRKLEIEIVRETARTDNWGSVDIFVGHGTKSHIHATGRLLPVEPFQR